MRDYFKNIEIDPDDGYIDFIGPAKPTSPHRLLKGRVKLSLERSVKIRSMTVKFKGSSRVCLHAAGDLVVDIQTMLLPKIKSSLFDNKSTTLGAGDHVIPWELQIPNVYPRSLLIKRASVNYKVELTITIGMGLQKKTVTTEHPIVLQRHLLPCKELSPLVGTRVYRYTVPGKFHYEVDCPRIISLDQGDIPFTVKYLCIADQKPVKCIRTQILQVEVYRCESISKSEADLVHLSKGTTSNSTTTDVFGRRRTADTNKKDLRGCAKFVKRKGVRLLHQVADLEESPWKQPILMRHDLGEQLTFGVESPLVSIYHQLEITFQFGQKFENIRAKVPILITTLPDAMPPKAACEFPDDDLSPTSPAFHESLLPIQKYHLETVPHSFPTLVTVDSARPDKTAGSSKLTQVNSHEEDIDTPPGSSLISPTREQVVQSLRQQSPKTTRVNRNNTTVPRHSRTTYHLPVITSSINLSQPAEHAESPSLSALGERPMSLRKSVSALDLSIPSTPAGLPERPAKSPRRRLRPLNIDLANAMRYSRAPLSDDTLNYTVYSSRHNSVASSEALPMIDRSLIRSKVLLLGQQQRSQQYLQRRQQQQHQQQDRDTMASSDVFAEPPSWRQPAPSSRVPSLVREASTQRVDPWLRRLYEDRETPDEDEDDSSNDSFYSYDDDDGDDEMSFYSEASGTSSREAPSLTSATSGGSSNLSLRSRPASPVYSPAPGLPAATSLLPQHAASGSASLVEETFAVSPISLSTNNSVQNTVASSSVLSPRTMYALHRQRVATERLPPPPPLPPPSLPPPRAPDEQGGGAPSGPDIEYYKHAELPPVPNSDDAPSQPYFEDSEEEQAPSAPVVGPACICPRHGVPALSASVSAGDSAHAVHAYKNSARPLLSASIQPPQLPRLSLGSCFADSLDLH